MKRTLQAVLCPLLFLAGCGDGSDLEEQEGVEQEVIFAPVSSPPGKLGGPCGKDYANCRTGEAGAKKFRELRKSAFKAACRPGSGSGYNLEVTVSVPKLVNDHRGKSDTLKVLSRKFEGASGQIGGGQVSYLRNGVEVVGWQYSVGDGDGNNINVVEHFEQPDLGGFETYLTLNDRAFWDRVAWEQRACSSLNMKPSWSDQCIECYIYLIGGGATLAYIGGAAAFAAETASASGAIGAMEFAAGAYIASAFSCDRWCAIGACNERNNECRSNPRNSVQGCDEELRGCCGRNMGRCRNYVSNNLCNWCGVY